jgi:three-Cys-motif partner protein
LDCFAGTSQSVDMDGEPHISSARLALQVSPTFTHAVFFEREEHVPELDSALRADFPGRNFRVFADCNLRIADGLAWLRAQGTSTSGPQLGPVFAFLDPCGLALDWTTVRTIATWTGRSGPRDYKRGHMPELLILFPTGPMRRTLPVDGGTPEATEARKGEVDRLFGDQRWREVYAAQRAGRIKGEDSWVPYVDLYRLALVDLGYTYTCTIEVRNTMNVIQHDFVFATTHPAGAKIMQAVTGKARKILPAMVQQEKLARKARDAPRLFDETDVDLERYLTDPDKWARFRDAPPAAFDPLALPLPPDPPQQGTLL